MALLPLTRRQRQILDFFQEYIASEGISPTLEETAQNFGLSKVTIFGHVAELERKGVLKRAAPGISRGLVLSSMHGGSSEDHYGDGQRESTRAESDSQASGMGGLNILGTIAAGAPIAALESPEILAFEELAPPGRDVYVLRVQGDSMIEDSIRDGDLVVVERRSNPRNSETVVAILAGEGEEEATLKRYYQEPDGRIRLQPANSTLQPRFVHAGEIEVRGVVIGVIRRY